MNSFKKLKPQKSSECVQALQNQSKRPIIGLLPLVDTEKESYWMLPGYMEGIIQAGGLPVMLPLSDNPQLINQLAETADGFLFTGGHDVSPELYGEKPIAQCGESVLLRDNMEKLLLKKTLELNKPVLGICRGIQLINAVLGGTLYQDLPTQYSSNTEHHQSPPYDIPIHTVTLDTESPLYSLLGAEQLEVNSYHHQAIKDLAPPLSAMAYSPDGLVEAVYMKGKKFLWAVQWHPEFSYKSSQSSQLIFKKFVSQCC